jgi:beta-lactamase regulating signal transducer with metallopeptidase domain
MTAFVASALLHSIWIGCLAAALAALTGSIVVDPSRRYRLSSLAFFLVIPSALTVAALTGGRAAGAVTAVLIRWRDWIVAAWIIGVAVESIRLLFTLRRIHGLKNIPIDDELLERLERLRRRAGVAIVQWRVVLNGVSPMAIGLFRPAIILPFALLMRMRPEELECVVLHELSHLRRSDRWANAAQLAVETLLFFHPAVRWHSAQLRHERELCCDALAVEIAGDRVTYARALGTTATLLAPSAALGASTGDLVLRIERLAGERPRRRVTPIVMFLMAAVAGFALTGDRAALLARAIESLRDERWFVRESALEMIVDDPGSAATGALITASGDRNWSIRQRALAELANREGIEATTAIIERCDDENWALRSDSIAILTRRRETSAIPVLKRLAGSDPNWSVRAEAAAAAAALERAGPG